MKKLTQEQSVEFKREGKVLLLSTGLYVAFPVPISFVFGLKDAALWGGSLFFGIMYFVDKRVK